MGFMFPFGFRFALWSEQVLQRGSVVATCCGKPFQQHMRIPGIKGIRNFEESSTGSGAVPPYRSVHPSSFHLIGQ